MGYIFIRHMGEQRPADTNRKPCDTIEQLRAQLALALFGTCPAQLNEAQQIELAGLWQRFLEDREQLPTEDGQAVSWESAE